MSTTATVLGLSHPTVIDWYNFIREECTSKLLRIPAANKMLGGVGTIVEIDESLMIKRKYNRGVVREQHDTWVFGLYERQSGAGWIQFVPQRDAQTLVPIVQAMVRPGTTIHSDLWRAYNNLSNLGFVHHTVNHSANFVDPATGVHTQSVEGYWSRAKQKIKAVYGSRLPFIPSYLDEFMWRERFGHNTGEAFANMLAHIAEHYH